MAHKILKQKDGRYCIFSSIVDDLILCNATKKQLFNFYLKHSEVDIEESLNKWCLRADKMSNEDKKDAISMIEYNKETSLIGRQAHKKVRDLLI